MKKFLCIMIILLSITACGNIQEYSNQSNPQTETQTLRQQEFTKGVWLSFAEINNLILSEKGFESEFAEVLGNLASLKITDLYFHVRSHCDSVVKSNIFPMTKAAQTLDFDILEYVINACHSENIRVHAWINPYRVDGTSSDTAMLDTESPAYKWLNDANNNNNVILFNGIYLNPAADGVRNLITAGIDELTKKYDIDGIHFDDYFYPTTDENFDKSSYENYKSKTANPLDLENWRRANVDALISDCKTAIEQCDKNIVFSVSPSASIEKNYSTHYADVEGWCKKGLIDEIIPQLYFGFNHTDKDFCFEKLLNDWTELVADKKVLLKIGLAPYKIGTSSATDGKEWLENGSIISKETEICLNNITVSGICYFSYTSLFSQESMNTAERSNLIGIFDILA